MNANETGFGWRIRSIPLGPMEMETQTFCVFVAVIVVAVVYVFSSIVLLYYPTLLHRKKHLAFVLPRHISHRGGAGERLESTLSAFRHSYSEGTEMFEVDAQMTADGVVVVCHDDSLERLTGEEGRISEKTYEDLPLLRETQSLHFYHKSHVTKIVDDADNPDDADADGVTKDRSTNPEADGDGDVTSPPTAKSPADDRLPWTKVDADRKIMTLGELFRAFPTTPVNIDTKRGDDAMLAKISALVKKHEREHITVWGNMDEAVTRKCLRVNPNMPVFFSFRRSLMTVFSFFVGLLPFLPLKESCFEVMMPSIFLTKCSGGGLEDLGFFSRLLIRCMDLLLMRAGLVAHLARRGIPTFLWVLNDEEDFQRAFVQVGCAGVMTDFPSRLKLYLDANSAVFEDDKIGCVSKRGKGDVGGGAVAL